MDSTATTQVPKDAKRSYIETLTDEADELRRTTKYILDGIVDKHKKVAYLFVLVYDVAMKNFGTSVIEEIKTTVVAEVGCGSDKGDVIFRCVLLWSLFDLLIETIENASCDFDDCCGRVYHWIVGPLNAVGADCLDNIRKSRGEQRARFAALQWLALVERKLEELSEDLGHVIRLGENVLCEHLQARRLSFAMIGTAKWRLDGNHVHLSAEIITMIFKESEK